MTIVFILLASVLLELLLFGIRPLWAARRVLAVLALLSGAFGIGALVVWQQNLFSVLLGALGAYRLFNLLRVVEGRMHQYYLRWATRRTALVLLLLQLLLGAVWLLWDRWHVAGGHGMWTIIASTQLAVSLMLLLSVRRNLLRTHWHAAEATFADNDLPSISVAIPARNETEDLEQCLYSLIASDYPKLEILVLDDCSQNKRTPEIIRQFAHDGVRFVQGEEPQATWLPKNQAYDKLAQEASGKYIIFCGVDVRFEPQSIRRLVTAMQSKRKRMMSILPQRQRSAYAQLSLVQAMRYAWELALPRRQLNRPPVLSSCWIIERQALQDAGGFAAVTRAIVPEAHFARQLIASDSYSFMRANEVLGISSGKSVQEQRATAIRMRYPQLHRRPEQVALVSLLEAGLLFGPFALSVSGLFVSIGAIAHILAVAASAILLAAYLMVALSTHVNNWWLGAIAPPLALLSDIALLHYSMYRYEFGNVDWKGRNVCVPVMHTVPKLPKL